MVAPVRPARLPLVLSTAALAIALPPTFTAHAAQPSARAPVAAEATEVFVLTRSAWQGLIAQYPELAFDIHAAMARTLRDSSQPAQLPGIWNWIWKDNSH